MKRTFALLFPFLALTACQHTAPLHSREYFLLARHSLVDNEHRNGLQEFAKPAQVVVPEFVVGCAGSPRDTSAELVFESAGKKISCLYNDYEAAENSPPNPHDFEKFTRDLGRTTAMAILNPIGIYETEDRAIADFPQLGLDKCTENVEAGSVVTTSRVSLKVIPSEKALKAAAPSKERQWAKPRAGACAILVPNGMERLALSPAPANPAPLAPGEAEPLGAIELPLHPGRNGIKEIFGVDTDGDLIRDDLQRYIVMRFSYSERKRKAWSWVARTDSLERYDPFQFKPAGNRSTFYRCVLDVAYERYLGHASPPSKEPFWCTDIHCPEYDLRTTESMAYGLIQRNTFRRHKYFRYFQYQREPEIKDYGLNLTETCRDEAIKNTKD